MSGICTYTSVVSTDRYCRCMARSQADGTGTRVLYPWINSSVPTLLPSARWRIFAMMNVITSQFVDQTLEASSKDRRDHMVSSLMDAFSKTGVRAEMVTEEDFMNNLTHPSMRSFLKDLYRREEVSPEEIRKSRLFEMLDDDGSGEITRDELVLGCVRLTGSATSLDLAVLKLDVENLRRDVGDICEMHRAEGRMDRMPSKNVVPRSSLGSEKNEKRVPMAA
ncbi:unnamed protein product [Prorocentrum cordatum]|uniref:EF-hand domain-containing protein n=1 Tax=Prorocentrum cordatum TaxID=2364126 RepID=A0ABN9X6W4_9DINO|nr:unnamed protein product [Polarella glacialis]